VQTQSSKEQEGWKITSEIRDSWVYENIGFQLTLRILEKDGKYRLLFQQPANLTEDKFIELSGRPIKWLCELEGLPHNQYKALVGSHGYGETVLKDIATFLGTSVGNYFSRSNISYLLD